MIDLHFHIVPGVDDGAQPGGRSGDGEDACGQQRDHPYGYVPWQSFSGKSRGLPAGLPEKAGHAAPGDLLGRDPVEAGRRDGDPLDRGDSPLRRKAPPAGQHGGNWILVEFVFDIPESQARRRLEFLDRQGYQMILAHPERYDFVQQDPGCLREIVGERLLLQVNKGSLLGDFGAGAIESRTGYSAGGWQESSRLTPMTRCSARRT